MSVVQTNVFFKLAKSIENGLFIGQGFKTLYRSGHPLSGISTVNFLSYEKKKKLQESPAKKGQSKQVGLNVGHAPLIFSLIAEDFNFMNIGFFVTHHNFSFMIIRLALIFINRLLIIVSLTVSIIIF